MSKFLTDLRFEHIERGKNVRFYQKEYGLVGILNANIQHAFLNINQQIADQGKYWMTVKKFLDGGIIKYIVDLDNGQGRAEKTTPLTEYQCKSLLSNWEQKIKQYNIYK